jgi:hypothetical protein
MLGKVLLNLGGKQNMIPGFRTVEASIRFLGDCNEEVQEISGAILV